MEGETANDHVAPHASTTTTTMRLPNGERFKSERDGMVFYLCFSIAWTIAIAMGAVAVKEVARTAWRLVTVASSLFAVMLPCFCVMASTNARRMRIGADAGEARKSSGAADPLGDAPRGRRRLCIVGAGASGLTATRHALRRGFDVTTFEKSDSVGGVWAYGHDACKVFNNVIQNVTKLTNVFADYPAKRAWPSYLGWRQTMDYLTGYAAAFSLNEHIELNAEIVRVERDEKSGEFEVTIAYRGESATMTHRIERFDYVWVASGQLTQATMPEIRGLSTFTGDVLHSSEYKTPTLFAEKNVLVVGLGSASGSDIAQELSWVASSVSLSIRTERDVYSRGIIGGVASMMNRVAWILPAWLGVLGYTYLDCYGMIHHLRKGVTDSGDLLSHFALNKIKRVDVIERVHGSTVYFTDGTCSVYDVIICATGYRRSFDFMAKNLQPNEKSGLFEDCILPSDPRVAYVLFVLPFGSHWQLAELQSMLLARVHDGTIPLPSRETMATLADSFNIVGTHEHLAEWWKHRYIFVLAPYIFPKLATLWRRPRLAMRILWSPWVAPFGEWASENDRDRTCYRDSWALANVTWSGHRLNRCMFFPW